MPRHAEVGCLGGGLHPLVSPTGGCGGGFACPIALGWAAGGGLHPLLPPTRDGGLRVGVCTPHCPGLGCRLGFAPPPSPHGRWGGLQMGVHIPHRPGWAAQGGLHPLIPPMGCCRRGFAHPISLGEAAGGGLHNCFCMGMRPPAPLCKGGLYAWLHGEGAGGNLPEGSHAGYCTPGCMADCKRSCTVGVARPSCMAGVCTEFSYVLSRGGTADEFFARGILHARLHGGGWGIASHLGCCMGGLHALGGDTLSWRLRRQTGRGDGGTSQLHSSRQARSAASSACAVAAAELAARRARGWLNAPVKIWVLSALRFRLSVPH